MENREKLPVAAVFRHDELDMWLSGKKPHVQVESPIGTILVEISVKEAHRILETLRDAVPESDKAVCVMLVRYASGETVMGFSVLRGLLELQRNTMDLPPAGTQNIH